MSSNLRAAASNAARLALRSVHIKLYPTAATFAERKEVLRVVQRFGEVEWFKSLKVGLCYLLSVFSPWCFLLDFPPGFLGREMVGGGKESVALLNGAMGVIGE